LQRSAYFASAKLIALRRRNQVAKSPPRQQAIRSRAAAPAEHAPHCDQGLRQWASWNSFPGRACWCGGAAMVGSSWWQLLLVTPIGEQPYGWEPVQDFVANCPEISFCNRVFAQFFAQIFPVSE
jgi:hypothetical protein